MRRSVLEELFDLAMPTHFDLWTWGSQMEGLRRVRANGQTSTATFRIGAHFDANTTVNQTTAISTKDIH